MRTVWIYSLQISDTGRVYRDIPPSEAEVVDEFGGIPRIVKILNSGKIIKTINFIINSLILQVNVLNTGINISRVN